MYYRDLCTMRDLFPTLKTMNSKDHVVANVTNLLTLTGSI